MTPAPGSPDATTVAIDIGGTWTRTRRTSPRRGAPQTERTRTPRLTDTADPAKGVCDLIEGIVRSGDGAPVSRAAISLGAAIDHSNGQVLGSGPLFGGWTEAFNLEDLLSDRLPDIEIRVWNDVSALAVEIAAMPAFAQLRRIAVVTVSSGIAERVIDPSTGAIATGAWHGLQGEIGHLPTSFSFSGEALHRPCACGAMDHVSSFSSGFALEHLTAELMDPATPGIAGFAKAVRNGEPKALSLLDATLAPLAQVLLCQLAVDPDIDRIVLTGGVVVALGDTYVDRLAGAMEDCGLYGVTSRFPDAIRRILVAVPEDDARCALGALTLSGWREPA